MKITQVLLGGVLLIGSMSALAQSGCCSWHGGVDYCGADGHVYCRDGQQSPSCMCHPNAQGTSSATDKNDDREFKLFSSRDMDNPNPYLEPFAYQWQKKHT